MLVAIALAAEKVFQLAVFIIVGDILRAVAISNEEIAIGIYRSFGRYKFFGFFVNACFERDVNSHQYFAINSSFIYLVFYRIGDKQEFRTILIDQSQAMRAREIMPPGIKQFARFAIDQHIVFSFVGQQQYPAFFILHHFVAIVHRINVWISFAPFGVHAVTHIAVPVYGTLVFC